MHAAPLPIATPASQPLRVRIVRSLQHDARWRVAAFSALCALGVSAFKSAAPDNDPTSLARAIGQATGGVVRPEDVRWEPSGGVLSDLVLGRFALVLSSATAGGPRDVYRVRVRVTPEGHPLSVGEAHDLTQTPLGDDHALVVRGTRAAFATFAYGQEQSVTALDLSGEGAQNSAKTPLERFTAAITNVQQTGTPDGIARVDVGFDSPGERVGLVLDETTLDIDLADPNGQRHATLDLARDELATQTPGMPTSHSLGGTQPTESKALGMHSEPARHLPKRFVFWAVDTVRAVPWIGPAPVAWLEEKVFALKDSLKQATFHSGGAQDELAATPPKILETTLLGDEGAWPPVALPSIWKSTEPGEGAWKPFAPVWMRKFAAPGSAAEAPPAFYQTFVRPDESRPYSHVILVEMDTRQLDLDMEAGTEDPKPLTGQHGPGRLPRDPAVYTRVVAAFNGGFKTEHGNYGMMVHKRVLLPPVPNAATVLVGKDGRTSFGTWGATPAIPDDIVSFRQNLDALVDGGEVNPSKRLLWGYTLPGTGMQTERSGLCVTRAGHMIYAWGDDVSATALGKAMRTAGCDYGMHLDMNPHHTGFLFTTIKELKGHAYKSEPLTSLMEMSTDRYIEYAAKDFFYVMMREPAPATLAGKEWAADPGTQPAPSWSPGLWATTSPCVRTRPSADCATGEVTLTSIDADRARYRIVAGTAEPDSKTGSQPSYELDDEAKKLVVMSVTLGIAGDRHARGLVVAGKRVLPIGEDESVLMVDKDGAMSIVASNDPALGAAGIDATVLPSILRGGSIGAHADLPFSHKASLVHAALGIAPDGRVVVARGEVSSARSLAQALKSAGCANAVLLDRGEDAHAMIRRAGTSTPPIARDRESTLFVLGVSMKPRAFHFKQPGTP